MRHVPNADGEHILAITQDTMAEETRIRTDGWRSYQTLGKNGYSHDRVIVRKDKSALQKLKWIHVMAANVKGNLRGIYHGASEKHLNRYLAECLYRFNRRFWDSELFNRTVSACVSTDTVTFAEPRA